MIGPGEACSAAPPPWDRLTRRLPLNFRLRCRRQWPTPLRRKLKAAFPTAASGSTWCASGKEAAEQWGKWFGVDVTWFDGGLNIDVQRKAVEDMATGTWDFVAIQTLGIDTLVDPVSRMIAKKIPVVQMDTLLSKNDIGAISFLEPDNEYMGEVVGEALFQAIGAQGNVIQTQGALGHTGAQRRAAGFRKAMARYPNVKLIADDTADWDINKVATLWKTIWCSTRKSTPGIFIMTTWRWPRPELSATPGAKGNQARRS